MPESNMDDFRALCDAHLEGRLTDEQMTELSRALREDAELRRFFVEYCHLDAGLKVGGGFHFDQLPETLDQELSAESKTIAFPLAPNFFRREWIMAAAACLAFLLFGLWAGLETAPRLEARAKAGVGFIADTAACQWGESVMPTAKGSRLQPGRLSLSSGIATLKFDSGAKVTLEGPAEFLVVDEMHCAIEHGQMTADVPPEAVGFTVTTPNGKVVDFGTRFGINANRLGSAGVEVFEGLVEVRHPRSGRTLKLQTGERAVYDAQSVHEQIGDIDDILRPSPHPTPAEPFVQISTATGNGRATYVHQSDIVTNVSDTLLLVKNSARAGYHRKAYLGFDLRPLNGRRVKSASLTLAFEPTGYGFASAIPDCEFEVYGVLDDDLDNWDPKSLTWQTAPANQNHGARLDANKTMLLGRFSIARTERSTLRQIDGDALRMFLNDENFNEYATLIVIRSTREKWWGGLVHGFAGNHHPTAPAPTLRIVLE